MASLEPELESYTYEVPTVEFEHMGSIASSNELIDNLSKLSMFAGVAREDLGSVATVMLHDTPIATASIAEYNQALARTGEILENINQRTRQSELADYEIPKELAWIEALGAGYDDLGFKVKDAMYNIYEGLDIAGSTKTSGGLKNRMAQLQADATDTSTETIGVIENNWKAVMKAMADPDLTADAAQNALKNMEYVKNQALTGLTPGSDDYAEMESHYDKLYDVIIESISRGEFQARMEDILAFESDAADKIKDALSGEFGAELDLTTMIAAGFSDIATVMADIGSDAYDAFADGMVSRAETQDIVDRLRDAKWADPEAFASMGGDEALEYFDDLNRKLMDLEWTLQDIATYKALDLKVPIELEARRDALVDSIRDGIASGEPYLLTAKVGDMRPPDLEEFARALWWEDYGGSETQESLGDYADDLEMLAEAIDNITEHHELLSDAFDIVTGQAGHEAETIDMAAEALKHYTDIDPNAIDRIREVFDPDNIKEAAKAMTNYGETIDNSICALSKFGRWQEDVANNMFQSSFIGSEGYLEFDTLRDLTQQAHTLEFAIAAQGLDPDSAEAKALAAEYFETKELAIVLNVDVPENQAWIDALFGGGGEEDTPQTNASIPVTADVTEAESEIDTLKTSIEESTTVPVQLDTADAWDEIWRIQEEITAPLTIPVYIDLMDTISGLAGTISDMIWDAIGDYDRRTTRAGG